MVRLIKKHGSTVWWRQGCVEIEVDHVASSYFAQMGRTCEVVRGSPLGIAAVTGPWLGAYCEGARLLSKLAHKNHACCVG